MLIDHTEKVVTSLTTLLPGAFVFVIDTMDRSFLFKSGNTNDCQSIVLQLDNEIGIKNIVKNEGRLLTDYCSMEIGIRYLSSNTFVGYCLKKPFENIHALSIARKTLIIDPL